MALSYDQLMGAAKQKEQTGKEKREKMRESLFQAAEKKETELTAAAPVVSKPLGQGKKTAGMGTKSPVSMPSYTPKSFPSALDAVKRSAISPRLDAHDHADESQYRSTKKEPTPAEKAQRSRVGLNFRDMRAPGDIPSIGYDDFLYDAVNGDEGARRAFRSLSGYDYQGITDEQKKMFNSIYASSGKEAAHKYIDSLGLEKAYTVPESAASGFVQAMGIPSVVATLLKAASSISGDEEKSGQIDEGYREYLDETAQKAQQHPVASGAGMVGGVLGLMSSIASGVGAIPGFASMPAIAQSLLSGAAGMGGATAIQNAGNVATGLESPSDYGLDVLTSAGAGTAGGLVAGKVGALGNAVLQKYGLAQNMLARTVAAGFVGAGGAAARSGVRQGSDLLRGRDDFDSEELLKDALVGFAFSSIGFLTRNFTASPRSAASQDEGEILANKYFKGMTKEEAKVEYRRLSRMYHPDLHMNDTEEARAAAEAAMKEINTAWSWINKTSGAQFYQDMKTAKQNGDAAGYERAKSGFDESVTEIAELAAGGAFPDQEAQEAVAILEAVRQDGAITPTEDGTATTITPTDPPERIDQDTRAALQQAAAEMAGTPEPALAEAESATEIARQGGDEIPAGEADVGGDIIPPPDNGLASPEGRPQDVEASDSTTQAEVPPAEVREPDEEAPQFPDGKAKVDGFAKGLPTALATTIREMYNDGQEPGAYLEDMMKAYKSGGEGITDPRDVFGPELENAHITLPQFQAAMLAGWNSRPPLDVKPAEKPITIASNPELRGAGGEGVKPVEKSTAGTAQGKIADGVMKFIQSGEELTPGKLYSIADEAYGGTMGQGAYTIKDAYDGMELAVNRYLMDADFVKKANGDALTATETVKKLVKLLSKLPTQGSKRTEEMQSFQQFSTPPNIAYLAAWVANITGDDVILEPSAGIGGLALWGKAWGATVYGNELSTRRLEFLKELGLDGVFNLNAEQIDNVLPDDIKPSLVIMNPPFSSTAGRTSTNKTANAKRHIEQALERLEPGGRLVAILGKGMADDSPSFRQWWDELRTQYSIPLNIRIDGENYRKYGTTWDVQLVVIDKTGPHTGTPTITGEYKDLNEVPKILEVVRNARGVLDTGAGAEQNAPVPGVQSAGKKPVPQQPVPSASPEGSAGGVETGGKPANKQAGLSQAGQHELSGGRAVSGKGPGAGVPSADHKQGASGRDVGQRSLGKAKPGEEAEGQTLGAPGQRGMQSGGQRVQLVRGGADSGLRKADVENPDSVYATYTPKKVHIAGAKPHPARLVESAAMAAVDPPDATYTPALPARIAKDGILSDAQLENVVYAGQAHAQMLEGGQRKGYFIGDGTGVGKGRQISGIIMDNFLQGRKKAVWISAKAGLINDAKRDWEDLGGDAADIFDMAGTKILKTGIQRDSGILFTPYSTLRSNVDARIETLQKWLGEDFDGVIAFDEAHTMKSNTPVKGKRGKTKPSEQALAGIALQRAFPKARVIYASATGATTVSNYGYLERLGLWGKGTAFANKEDFITKISAGGLAAMELVARDMKAMGVYMARSISFDDVKYDTIQHDLNPMQTEIYNTMSRAWQKVFQEMMEAAEYTEGGAEARRNVKTAVYGGQQRFYNQILTSMAMPTVIEDIRKELEAGHSCVIQLTNTNESQLNRSLEKNAEQGGDLDELDLTPSDMLADLVLNSFPVVQMETYEDEDGNERTRPVLGSDGKPVLNKKAVRQRDALIEELKMMKVPDGPLEMLFDAFGVDEVAEITGRSRRVVEKKDAHGHLRRVVESRSVASRTADAKAFQDGKKHILVFSQAGGTGFSFHADLRAKNQEQRIHYLLQSGWQADEAVQGFGRTHRSNQASAPVVRLVTTNVMGQKRFTSTIARRLDQLGALTKGQRQAGSGVFGEKDNLENPIASDALANYYKQLFVSKPEVLDKLGLTEQLVDKQTGGIKETSEALRNVSLFLNRILALEVDEQNEIFQGFYDTFERAMDIAISQGTVDMGLENYKADKIEVKDEKVVREDPSGANTVYVQMRVYNKPVISSLAQAKARSGFRGIVRLEDGSVRAVYEISSKTNERTGEVQRRFKLEGPMRGKSNVYVEATMKEKTTEIAKSEWAQVWKDEIAKAPEYNEGTLHLLTGTLLPIWNRLPTENTRVMRVLCADGRQYLGRVIQPEQIDGILRSMGVNRTKETYTGKQVASAVLGKDQEAVFRDNRMRLTRRRVSGEWRLELTGQNIWYIARSYPGIFSERIGSEFRNFVPTGEQGEKILEDIMRTNPVIEIRDRAVSDEVEFSREAPEAGRRSHPEEWTTTRAGSGDKNPMSLPELFEKMRHDFGFNLTKGHVRGAGVRGQFNQRDKGIRIRLSQDLPTACHELGHALDDRYGITDHLTGEQRKELLDVLGDLGDVYKDSEKISEGLAEYMRKFLTNSQETERKYPAFTDHMKKALSPVDLTRLESFADEVNAYLSLGADTATASVHLREDGLPDARGLGEKAADAIQAFRQQWIDSNQGIKHFDEATGSDTYTLATNAAYADAIAGRLVTGDLTDQDGQYVAPGLRSALDGLDLKDKATYKLFGEYLIVKHGPERLAEGKQVFAREDQDDPEWMAQRQAAIEAEHPEFVEISERLYQFQKNFLQTWGVGTGLISEETAKEWADRWKYYVPFNRFVSEDRRGRGAKRGFANQNIIRRAFGSGLDFIHPVDNIITNIVRIVNAGVRNNVMRAITNAALTDEGSDATFLEKIPTPMQKHNFSIAGVKENILDFINEIDPTDQKSVDAISKHVQGLDDILTQYSRGKAAGNVVTVMRGGRPEFWKVNDPLLLESITNMTPARLPAILEAWRMVTRLQSAFITGTNLIWSVTSNAPRDLQTMLMYSDDKNPLKLLKNVGLGYVNRVKDTMGAAVDPYYAEFLAMGGGQESFYTADRDLAKVARRKLGRVRSKNPFDGIAFISDTIETGPRFAAYRLARLKGLSPQEAIYISHDITVNFRRRGTKAQGIMAISPFINASIQGVDKHFRHFTAADKHGEGKERAKTAAGRWGFYLAMAVGAAALTAAVNLGDDDRKKYYEQLSSYTKNNYYVIPINDEDGGFSGRYIAIPKGRDTSTLISFLQRLMEYSGGNKDAFNEFYEYWADNNLPNIVGDLAQVRSIDDFFYALTSSLSLVGTGADILANRDFLGRPIVSNALKDLPKEQQYTGSTSQLAYQLGQALHASPQQIDYILTQTFGYVGKYSKAIAPVDSSRRDLTLGLRNQFVKDAQYSTDLVNRLYDRAEETATAHNGDPEDTDKAITAAMDDRMKRFYSRYNGLARNSVETAQSRGTRQAVLDMVDDYLVAAEGGFAVRSYQSVFDIVRQDGSTELLPSVMQSYVKDGNEEKHELSAVEYVEFQTDYNRLYWEYVEDNLDRTGTATEQRATLRAAKELAADQAKRRALTRMGLEPERYEHKGKSGKETVAVPYKYQGISEDEIITFEAQKDLANDDGGLSREEAIDIIQEMVDGGLSKEAAYTLYHAANSSWTDKNNPWKRYRP